MTELTLCTALRVRLPRPAAATVEEANNKVLEWENGLWERLHAKYEDQGMLEYVEVVLINDMPCGKGWRFVRHAEVQVDDGDVGTVEGAIAIIQDYLVYFAMDGGVLVSWAYRDPDFRINTSGGGAAMVSARAVGMVGKIVEIARKSAERLGIEILN